MAENGTPLGDLKRPTEEEIKKWFLDVDPLEPENFEFALVLGGTVSAGAYTAGAVDFLIEALDCLSHAQNEGTAPKHNVRLKLITGTSGGGVNAAIAARALAYEFPHVTRETPEAQAASNPFYKIWVNTLRLDHFLKTADIKNDLQSLLNGQPIDEGAASIIHFVSGNAHARPWVAAPLRVILTLTSLRGIPYTTSFGGTLTQSYVDHADQIRYALHYPGQTAGEARPDELALGFDSHNLPAWEHFSEFARATAAFPIGFPARILRRPTEHYRWRVVPYPPVPGGMTSWMHRWPDWRAMVPPGSTEVPDEWEFLAVDGGATDNEPIQLARTALAGLLGRNPRDPVEANRAVWLIDPFAGKAPLGPQDFTSFPAELGAVMTTLTQQTRYDTADLLMAADENVFSRFMLTPTRAVLAGEEAIASGGLGAFIGFACPAFMRFDFLLGRANCQKFLREQFVLAEENKLFQHWAPAERDTFRTRSGGRDNMLPIIPLVGTAATTQELDDWPKGKLQPETYRSAIEQRFRKIFELELSGSVFRSILSWIGARVTQKQAADHVIGAMNSYLEKAKL